MYETTRAGVLYKFVDTGNTRQTEWLQNNFSIWEPFTFQVFHKVQDKSKTCLDIGAWIGLTGIWLANHFDHVICVEGDKQSVISLRNNLNANDLTNYTIIDRPVSHTHKKVVFGTNAFLGETELNESTSQIKETAGPQDYEVETIAFSELIEGLDISKLGFVKCDIEGGEEDIVPDLFHFCKLYSLPLLLSFHTSWWKDKNLARFQTYFEGVKCFDENWNQVSNVVDFLQGNPMGTLFFLWPELDIPVSVLVPLYNGIEFLEECVKSIQEQIYKKWTCLIGVNGHGEDGGEVYRKAEEIVKKLEDSRFSIVNIPDVRGAPQAINWMVERVATKWVAHLDADDRWHPMKLQCQVKAIEMYGDAIDIMGTWCEYFGDYSGGPTIPATFIHGTVFEKMNPMIHSSILIKKHLAVYTDEFFGIYDYDCWCKNLLQGARFYNVPLPLTYHRVYNASAYNASGKQRPEEVRLKYFRHT